LVEGGVGTKKLIDLAVEEGNLKFDEGSKELDF